MYVLSPSRRSVSLGENGRPPTPTLSRSGCSSSPYVRSRQPDQSLRLPDAAPSPCPCRQSRRTIPSVHLLARWREFFALGSAAPLTLVHLCLERCCIAQVRDGSPYTHLKYGLASHSAFGMEWVQASICGRAGCIRMAEELARPTEATHSHARSQHADAMHAHSLAAMSRRDIVMLRIKAARP
jgi:hypothetical protein